MALNIDSLLMKYGLNIYSVRTVRPYAATILTCSTVRSLDEKQLTSVYSSIC